MFVSLGGGVREAVLLSGGNNPDVTFTQLSRRFYPMVLWRYMY